ncbi:MAG: hypothetical protein JNM40_08155 [Myxococcales bacterium]|nr:hypothetical protein [Myxococcales bacterium]
MTCSRMLFLGVAIGGGLLTISSQPLYAQAAGAAAKPKAATAAPAPKAGAAPATAPKAAAAPAAPTYPAGVPEAKLRITHHQVEVVSSSERHGARKDEVLFPGTRVDSAAGSGAEVNFADGTRIGIGENTSFSVYGVPPATPANAPAKKFVPGTNTITVGEITVTVPAPAAPPAGAKPAKPAPAKPSRTASFVTPVGKVAVNPGSTARISVEPKTGATRVSLYEGTATLTAKGKTVNLTANQGSMVANVTTPPTAAQELPAAPSIAGVPGLVLSTGGPVEVKGTYALAGAMATGWHVQVAQDSAFDSIVRDNRAAAAETRVMPTAVGPGDYYVRVSAVSADGVVGPWSAPGHVQVARVVLWPGGEGKRAAVQVDGKGVFCGLNGAELQAVGQPIPLQPAREHTLRCATAQSGAKPDDTSEFKISATQSGPVVAKLDVGAPTFNPQEGQREVRLQLADAAGSPITGATVVAEGTGGSRADAVQEVPGTGTYVTTAHWPAGKTGLGLRYTINGVENYESALPDAAPATASKDEPKEDAPAGDRPPAKSFAVELGLMGLTHVDIPRGVFGIGGGLEIGGRLKLPYGAFAFALRPQYEYFAPAPGASHIIGGGLLLAYRFRSLDAAWAPYIGVLPQFLAEYSFLARDGVQIQDGSWMSQVGLGGLLGAEIRLRRGGVFIEAGYRHVIWGRTERTDYASLNGVFGNLGYRVNF